MPTDKDEGGFITPPSEQYDENLRNWEMNTGFTRRDWLAGLAMQALTPTATTKEECDVVPKLSYKLADAMIVEGKK